MYKILVWSYLVHLLLCFLFDQTMNAMLSQIGKFFLFPLFISLLSLNEVDVKQQNCFSASYSISLDYSNENLPLPLKKRIMKSMAKNKIIYKMIHSATNSYELADSIARTCDSNPIIFQAKVLIRAVEHQTVKILPGLKNINKCYEIQKPDYLDKWEISGPVAYRNTNNRYFKAIRKNTEDYVIFDAEVPTRFNIKLIENIPGLVVEALIGNEKIKLLEYKTISDDLLSRLVDKLSEVNCKKFQQQADLDTAENGIFDENMLKSNDFQCVEAL